MNLCTYEDSSLYIYHATDSTPDPADYEMHIHQRCEMCYFMSGKGYYTIEGNNYEPFAGSIFLFRNAETHMLHIKPTAPYERFIIRFSPEEVFDGDETVVALFRNRELGHENMIICDNESQNFIRECYNRIERAILSNSSKTQILSLVRPVLYELAYAKQNTAQTQVYYKSNSEKLVSDIIAYINLNLTDIDNVEFLEQNFYFSRSYLNRIFKKITGSTIWDYIIVKRLMLARTLILNGEASGSAATKCGFADYSSFYRQYKNRFGVPPTKTRPGLV